MEIIIIFAFACWFMIRKIFKPITAKEYNSWIQEHHDYEKAIATAKAKNKQELNRIRRDADIEIDKERLAEKYDIHFKLTDGDYEYYKELERVELKVEKEQRMSGIKAKVLVDNLKKKGVIPKDTETKIV